MLHLAQVQDLGSPPLGSLALGRVSKKLWILGCLPSDWLSLDATFGERSDSGSNSMSSEETTFDSARL